VRSRAQFHIECSGDFESSVEAKRRRLRRDTPASDGFFPEIFACRSDARPAEKNRPLVSADSRKSLALDPILLRRLAEVRDLGSRRDTTL